MKVSVNSLSGNKMPSNYIPIECPGIKWCNMCCHNNHDYYAHPFYHFKCSASGEIKSKIFFFLCLTKLDFHISNSANSAKIIIITISVNDL